MDENRMTESKEINSFARLEDLKSTASLCQTALPFFISLHPWSVDTSPNKSWPFVLERVAVIHAHGHPPCHVGLSRDNLRGGTLISVCSSVHPVLMISADRLSVFDAHAHCSGRQYASCLAQTIREDIWFLCPIRKQQCHHDCLYAWKMPSTRLDDAYAHTCVPPKVPQLQEITGSSLALSVKRESGPQRSHVRHRPWGEMSSEEKN